MLILAHANGLGVDFHQLCQGVLEAAGDGDGGAEIDVVLPQLLRGQLGHRVHRRPGLTDHHVGQRSSGLPDQLCHQLLRLPAAGAVADGGPLNVILVHQLFEGFQGLLVFPFTEAGVEDGGVQHFAGAVHYGGLAAVDIAGVQPQGHMAPDRRLQEQRLQVGGKGLDGPLAGAVGELAPGLPAQSGEDQPVVGVLPGGLDHCGPGAVVFHPPAADQGQGRLRDQLHSYLEEPLLFSPVDGQDLVALDAGEGLGEVVVGPVDRVLLPGGPGGEKAVAGHLFPEQAAGVRIVRDGLRDDVTGARQSGLNRVYPLFRADKGFRPGLRGPAALLGQQHLCQGL